MALQFRRGTEAERVADGFVPASGEPVYATDTKKLYIGDGTTVGGVPVGSNNELEDLENVSIRSASIINIQSISASGNVVYVNTQVPHGFATGDSVLVSTTGKTDLNGIKEVTFVSINTFSFDQAVADFAQVDDSGAVRYEVSDEAILAYDQTTGEWVDQNFIYEFRDLGDVSITDPQNNDIIQYDSTESKFVNRQFEISIDDLNDVLIYESTLSNRQYIGYDSNLTVWRNIDYVDSLEDLSNVSISDPQEDEILTYNGTTWVNQDFTLNNFDLNALSDVEITDVQENQILQYTDSKWKNVANFVSLSQFADVNLSSPEEGEALIYNDSNETFQSRSFRLNDLQNVNDLTDQFELPDNSVLAFSNSEQVWKPQTFATLASRVEITINTGPLEDLEVAPVQAEIFPGFAIYKLKCSAAPSTVSMYVTKAFRDIDLSREEYEWPTQGIGLYAEMTPPDTSYRVITPVIYGFNDDVPIGNTAYLKVRNRTGYYQSNIEVKLTVLQIETLPDYG